MRLGGLKRRAAVVGFHCAGADVIGSFRQDDRVRRIAITIQPVEIAHQFGDAVHRYSLSRNDSREKRENRSGNDLERTQKFSRVH